MAVNTTMVLPLVGRIAAGQPIEAVQSNETISLADFVRSKEVFVLEVRGDSMQDEAILNGDYVMVEKSKTAHNGDIVVALVGGTDATLKRFYREGENIRLQPSNVNMQPIIVPAAVGGSAGKGDWSVAEVLKCRLSCQLSAKTFEKGKRPVIPGASILPTPKTNAYHVLVDRLLNRLFRHVADDLFLHLPALEHQ